MTKSVARCPICGGTGQPYGWVVERLVFRCTDCGVRFKDGAPGVVARREDRR
jgi:DNA-directed RNA polymerase subunit RPC12/RpoP